MQGGVGAGMGMWDAGFVMGAEIGVWGAGGLWMKGWVYGVRGV